MKRLEDIPKKNIHNIPERYFEDLPNIIRARISKEDHITRPATAFAHVFQYSLPAVLIITVALIYFNRNNDQSLTAQDLLAGVETAYLETYLEDELILASYDLAEDDDLTASDAAEIEKMIYFDLDDRNTEDMELGEFLPEDYELDSVD